MQPATQDSTTNTCTQTTKQEGLTQARSCHTRR